MSTSRINLNWTASTDNVAVVGYQIYRDGDLVDTVPGTSYGDTGLLAGSTHVYQVAAIDEVPNASDLSASASASTLSAPTGIFFRAGSSASAKSASTLTITRPPAAQTGDVLIASLSASVRNREEPRFPADAEIVRVKLDETYDCGAVFDFSHTDELCRLGHQAAEAAIAGLAVEVEPDPIAA